MTTYLQGGRVALSALSTFTNAAAHAVAEGDAGKLRDLAEQCRSWLRQYPNEPFFTTFESLFAKAASLIEIEVPKRYLENDKSSLRILTAISRFGGQSANWVITRAHVSRKSFHDRIAVMEKMGLVSISHPIGSPTAYRLTSLGRDVRALIL